MVFHRVAAALCAVALGVSAGRADAQTAFDQDVFTAVGRGVDWISTRSASIGSPSPGPAVGMAVLAMLDRPTSPGGPAVGFSGLSAADQGRVRLSLAAGVNQYLRGNADAEVAGFLMMAIGRYVETGGPMDIWVRDATLSASVLLPWVDGQNVPLAPANRAAVEGLVAARALADRLGNPTLVATIDRDLVNARAFLRSRQVAGGGFYYSAFSPIPSREATADYLLAMLEAGIPPTDGAVTAAMGWLRLNYRYSTFLDSDPDGTRPAWFYASTKAFALIEASGARLAIMPFDLGTLPAFGVQLEAHRNPPVDRRVLAGNPATVGFYAAQPQSWWYDDEYSVMQRELADGSFSFAATPGSLGVLGAWFYSVLTLEHAAACIDTDRDGVCDADDDCRGVPDRRQFDADQDGAGDACDPCPNDPRKTAPGVCGCGTPDADGDGDGTADCQDECPADPAKTAPGACGCGTPDADTDRDGTADCDDGCPADSAKTAPGACGCGAADADTDRDGTADCLDACPIDPAKTAPGICDCGTPDTDTDGDGTADCLDGCPGDAGKIAAGICGCGVADTDTDGDGTADCLDGCPADAGKTAAGICGCGVADTDGDGDGIADCVDACPADPANDADGDGVCGDTDDCPAAANADQADADGDGAGDACDACPRDAENDADGDGVCGDADACPGTALPESVPTVRLNPEHYADTDGDGVFDTTDGASSYTLRDTAGCSCEQIIDALGLGEGHRKFGCSAGVMADWASGVGGR